MEISISPIAKSVAKKMIIKHHYSHTISVGVSHCFGVYTGTHENEWFTYDEPVGVIVYAIPTSAQVYKTISPLVTKQSEILELTRLFIKDDIGEFAESQVIGQSIRWIRHNLPHIKVLVSYSDTGQDHLGTIYQATNFLYQGCRQSGGNLYSNDGIRWKHIKGLMNKYKTISNIPSSYVMKKATDKHRYVYLLGNKIQRKQLRKTLKYNVLPYPKSTETHSN